MITAIIAFLVMLNPFALFLYLEPIRKELSHKDFLKVLLKASLISFFIYATFSITGNLIFEKILQINFEAFRIFGGIIIFSFAYFFIVKGHKAFVTMKEDLDDLASEIALPFMVGAGTISLSVILGNNFPLLNALFGLMVIMVLNFIFIVSLKKVRDKIDTKAFKITFDKYMQILLRLNGFLVGAIGINMIVTGVINILA